MKNYKLTVKLSKDCWGSESYFGYKNNRQYTEAYGAIEDLKEDNPGFKGSTIQFKNIADKLIKVTDNNNLITTDIIESLKEYSEPIYFNDSVGKHFMMDFKVNNVWFESININNELTTIELNAYN